MPLALRSVLVLAVVSGCGSPISAPPPDGNGSDLALVIDGSDDASDDRADPADRAELFADSTADVGIDVLRDRGLDAVATDAVAADAGVFDAVATGNDADATADGGVDTSVTRSDASVAPDGGTDAGPCNAVALGGAINRLWYRNGSIPTLRGGVLMDGYYELLTEERIGGPSGVFTPGPRGGIEVRGNVITYAYEYNYDDYRFRSTYLVERLPSDLRTTRTCPSPRSEEWSYAASADGTTVYVVHRGYGAWWQYQVFRRPL